MAYDMPLADFAKLLKKIDDYERALRDHCGQPSLEHTLLCRDYVLKLARILNLAVSIPLKSIHLSAEDLRTIKFYFFEVEGLLGRECLQRYQVRYIYISKDGQPKHNTGKPVFKRLHPNEARRQLNEMCVDKEEPIRDIEAPELTYVKESYDPPSIVERITGVIRRLFK